MLFLVFCWALMFPLVLAIRRWRMAMRIDIICILVIYTLYDIPGCVPYYAFFCAADKALSCTPITMRVVICCECTALLHAPHASSSTLALSAPLRTWHVRHFTLSGWCALRQRDTPGCRALNFICLFILLFCTTANLKL